MEPPSSKLLQMKTGSHPWNTLPDPSIWSINKSCQYILSTLSKPLSIQPLWLLHHHPRPSPHPHDLRVCLRSGWKLSRCTESNQAPGVKAEHQEGAHGHSELNSVGRNCCRASAVTLERDARFHPHRSQRIIEGSKGRMDWFQVSLELEGRVTNVLKELKTWTQSSIAVRNVCYTLGEGAGFCLHKSHRRSAQGSNQNLEDTSPI